MSQFSENVREIEPSATLAVAALARRLKAEGRDIIDLSAGEPDFPTPDFIAQAGADAIRDGRTRYTPAAGLPELRAAVARDLGRGAGRTLDPDGVVITAGAKQALFNACFTLFGPGDRVLLPVPYWTSYPSLIHLSRAEPVPVAADAERGFKVTPDDLDRAADDRTRGLIINSPSNPTGAVYTRDELEAIAQWAADHQVWLISDEIYGRICHTAERATGLMDLDPALTGRAVVVDGASKFLAMTGWRLGFSYAPADLAGEMAAVQSHMTSNANTPAQYAALAALRDDPLEAEPIQRMITTFRERRDLVIALMEEHLPDTPYVRPDGAFYLFFRTDAFYRDGRAGSIEFCRWLLESAGVALVPGEAFGDDRYVRMSFASGRETIEEGIRRVAEAVKE